MADHFRYVGFFQINIYYLVLSLNNCDRTGSNKAWFMPNHTKEWMLKFL